ncbi:MAG: MerR family transcriptional regulator [Gemmatimonadetes bacterium]|nr:MerR family transcriptional regulator [Gemmatimonadota bacterium]
MNQSHASVGYPIRVVAQRTGLSGAVIRAWERRYGAVEPQRSPAGQRVYGETDVQRLQLLAELVRTGRSISSIAELPTGELEELLAGERAEAGRTPSTSGPALDRLREDALRLVEGLRPDDLERLLTRSALAYRTDEFIRVLLVPLLTEIGIAWQSGRLGPSSEHVASVTIRRFLEWLTSSIQVEENAPLVVTGTPTGQRHEFGALLAGIVAAEEQWRVRFLGPDLPASEIAKGAGAFGADAVALSALFPPMERLAVEDVAKLRSMLPARIPIIIGGPASAVHADEWPELGITYYGDLDDYRAGLRALAAAEG